KSPSPKTVRRVADAGSPDGGSGRPRALLIGGAAAALVVIVALIIILSRKPSPPVTPLANAGVDAEVQRRFDDLKAIQKNAMGRPGEYPAVRAKWKAAEDQYATTPNRALFAGGRVDFEGAVNAEADAAAKEAVDDATKALSEAKTAAAPPPRRPSPPES